MSVETAARFLNARDIEGIVIGDGFGPRVVEALLTVLAEDARFRDLPVGVLGGQQVSDERLPNLIQVESDPQRAGRAPAAVRAPAGVRRPPQAPAEIARDRRHARSRNRTVRPRGLLARSRPRREGRREQRRRLSVARFSFEETNRRPRPSGCRAAVQPAGAQHRFRLPGAGRLDPGGLHRDRSAQRPCGRPPHRQRAQAHHAVPRSRPQRDQADGYARHAQAQRQSLHAWWRASAPIPRLPPADCANYSRLRFSGGIRHVRKRAHHRCDFRRRLPVVLHRQAIPGAGDRAQARHPGRGAASGPISSIPGCRARA